MTNTKSAIEVENPAAESPNANPLDERLKLLAKKIDFLVERAGTSHRELLELREEIGKALAAENAAEKAELVERGEKLLSSPKFEIAIEKLAADPLLLEKVAASEIVFEKLRKQPKTDLAKLDAKKLVKNPELLAAIAADPAIWEKIKTNATDAITVVENLRDPKSWSAKIGATGDSILEFVKKNPELTTAATIGLTLGGILLLLGEGKIKKAFGAISLGIAGFLGLQKWGEEVGWLIEFGLKKLGISQEMIDEMKKKKEQLVQKGKDIAKKTTGKIERGVDLAKNWKTEVADKIGEQVDDEKLKPILAKWSAGEKLSESDKMAVSERLLHNGFLFVVVGGITYLVKGATFFPVKWAEGVGGSVHGLFSRNFERMVLEYVKGGAPFAVLGGSIAAAKAFFTTEAHKSIWKSAVKGAASGGLKYGYKIPITVVKGGRVAGKFVFDAATKGITKMAAEGLAKAAARAERPLAKAAIRKMEKQLLKLCSENATKKFLAAILKKTGMKKVGAFLAKRAAAAGGSALTGVGTVVSIGILAWTLWDVGVMSYEGYQLYDLNDKLTERGKMPIKNIYLDPASQKKLSEFLPDELKDIDEVQTLEIFKKLPTATLFIEREGRNDREKWTFENGEVVDISIEKI